VTSRESSLLDPSPVAFLSPTMFSRMDPPVIMNSTEESGFDVDRFCKLGPRFPHHLQFRSSREDEGLLPLLVLNRDFSERISVVYESLPDCIFLFLCILALGSLFPTAEDDILSEIRFARHELGLVLAESSRRYMEVSSEWTASVQ
jgi:hypothetical protein